MKVDEAVHAGMPDAPGAVLPDAPGAVVPDAPGAAAKAAWQADRAKRYGAEEFVAHNRSGVDVQPAYGADDALADAATMPGQFPYRRGIYPVHYQYQRWMDLQIIGFGTASQLRTRMDLLKDVGGAEGYFGGEAYNIIFDMAGSMGFDPDHPAVQGSVADCGVSIATLDDFVTLFQGKDLRRTHVSMVSNAGSPAMLALYFAAAEQMGFGLDQIAGNITNYIWDFFGHCGGVNFSPRGSYRMCVDVAAYCAEHAPRFNTVTVSEHNICEAGATSVQAVALTIATIIALNEECRALGVEIDDVAHGYGFHVRYGEDIFEDVAKTRALRALYARVNAERFGCTRRQSLQAKIHGQTAGSLLTVQQPLNNIVRNAYGALAATLAGVNGMTINAYDEALGLPTEEAVTLSLRTSQILAEEQQVTKVTDPLAGSYYVEQLTASIERACSELIEEIDARGGLVQCIEQGWAQALVTASAFEWRQQVEAGTRRIVGVNSHVTDEEATYPVFQPDPAAAAAAAARVQAHRAQRDQAGCDARLGELRSAGVELMAGRSAGGVTACLVAAARAGATLGEMQAVLFETLGRNK